MLIEDLQNLFSYNNKSKIPINRLTDIIKNNSNILTIMEFKHKENIQANLTTNKEWLNSYKAENKEYLILCEK